MRNNITLYNLEKLRNYGLETENNNIDKQFMSDYLNKNYDKLECEEIKKLYLQITSEKDARHGILQFELKYLRILTEEKISLNKFRKKVIGILNRYQCKAGGFDFDDIDWIIHDYSSKEYNLDEYEMIFENSIDEKLFFKGGENFNYLKLIIKMLKRLAKNIKISCKVKRGKDHLLWILIKGTDCTYNNTNVFL